MSARPELEKHECEICGELVCERPKQCEALIDDHEYERWQQEQVDAREAAMEAKAAFEMDRGNE